MVLGQAEETKPVIANAELPAALEKEMQVMEEALKPALTAGLPDAKTGRRIIRFDAGAGY